MKNKPVHRVQRLLTLVPYFRQHPGITKVEAAREWGISVAQLEKDLSQLWMCGKPGGGGGDLIDIQYEGDTVTITDSQGVDRPLRLTAVEASTLLLALQFLVGNEAGLDRTAVHSAMAKIDHASGVVRDADEGGQAAGPVAGAPDPVGEAVAAAVRDGRALRLRYYTASRDAVTDRVVDPIRLQVLKSKTYLHAWCRDVEDLRMFRTDRIDEAEVLDEPSAPGTTRPADVLADFTDASAGLPAVRLAVSPNLRWVVDYFPMETVAVHDDGSAEVRLRYATEAWLTRTVAGFGGRLRILDDPRTAAAVHAHASAALEAYEAAEAAGIGS